MQSCKNGPTGGQNNENVLCDTKRDAMVDWVISQWQCNAMVDCNG